MSAHEALGTSERNGIRRGKKEAQFFFKAKLALFAALLSVAILAPALAGPRNVNHVFNPGFEEHADGKVRGWSRYGEGYELVREGRDDRWCIRCSAVSGQQTMGAAQDLVFDPPVQHPILISGWSKAAGVEGGEYCVYLDVHYADGTRARHGSKPWGACAATRSTARPCSARSI